MPSFPCAVLVAMGGMLATPALAVEPANIQVGPIFVVPTIEVEGRWEDNVLRQDENEFDSWVSETTPNLQAWLLSEVNTYSVSYQLKDFRYSDSSEDDFTDHTVNLDIHHEFNVRNVLNVYGEYFDGHEERGTGVAEGSIADLVRGPVELERTIYGGDYNYGNRDSKGQLKLAVRHNDYDYQNFDEITRFRNHELDTLDGTLFWKFGPKTDLLAQVRYIKSDYDEEIQLDLLGSLDAHEYNYLVGIRWDPTAKTEGSIKLGSFDRNYDSSARASEDGFQWEIDASWKPRTYSVVNFNTSRYSKETNGLGDFIDTREHELSWNHDWNSRSTTILQFIGAEDDYEGTDRSDDRRQLQAKYSYAMRRWVDLAFGYRYEERESSNNDRDYRYNAFFIEAKLSL